jgi:hypothetical protein
MRGFNRHGLGRALLLTAAFAAIFTLIDCSSSYKQKHIPMRIQRYYSDTVYVDASDEDLMRKIGVYMVSYELEKRARYKGDLFSNDVELAVEDDGFRFRNIGYGVSILVKDGQYKVDLPETATSDDIRDLKIFDIELKQAIINDPLNDIAFDNLMKSGQYKYEEGDYKRAQEDFFKAAMGRPESDDALMMYGSSLMGTRQHSKDPHCFCVAATRVFELLYDNDDALENIAVAWKAKDNVDAMRSEVARLREEEREERARKLERIANIMDAAAGTLSSVAQVYGAATGVQSGSDAGGSGGGGGGGSSANCANYQTRYDHVKRQRDNNASRNASREAKAAGKNAVHSINSEYSAASAGDYRVINSTKANIREYERMMNQIASEASRAGCTVR